MSRLGLGLSITLHGLLFVAVLIGPRPPKFEWEPQEAIAVELVSEFEFPEADLPTPQTKPEKVIEPERKPPVTETERVPEIVEEPDPEPEPKVEEPKPAAEKPKAKPQPPPRKFQRIGHKAKDDNGPSLADRLKGIVSEDPDPSQPPADPTPTAETPEVLAESTPSSSTEVQATDFPFAWYLNQVRNKAHDAWDPPGDRMIASRASVVLVRIRIERDGRVTKIDVEPSGNPSLDASVKRAVQAAQPFGILPDAWEEDVLDLGIRFSVGGSS